MATDDIRKFQLRDPNKPAVDVNLRAILSQIKYVNHTLKKRLTPESFAMWRTGSKKLITPERRAEADYALGLVNNYYSIDPRGVVVFTKEAQGLTDIVDTRDAGWCDFSLTLRNRKDKNRFGSYNQRLLNSEYR